MARRLNSFLLRYWDLGSGSERIEIEHIQSGEKRLAISMADAVAWMREHADRGVKAELESPTSDDTGTAHDDDRRRR